MHYFIIFFETCDEASLLFSKFNLLSATTFRAFSSEKKTINYKKKCSKKGENWAIPTIKNPWSEVAFFNRGIDLRIPIFQNMFYNRY